MGLHGDVQSSVGDVEAGVQSVRTGVEVTRVLRSSRSEYQVQDEKVCYQTSSHCVTPHTDKYSECYSSTIVWRSTLGDFIKMFNN